MFKKNLSIVSLVFFAFSALCFLTAPSFAAEEAFPSRPLEFWVYVDPGSTVDINARAVAPSWEKALGSTVVVQNKIGGAGAICFNFVAQSKPDGYNAGLGALNSICQLTILSDMAIDPRKDFKYLGTTVTDILVIAARADAPYNDIKELAEYAKANPGKVNYGGSGSLSTDAMLCYDVMNATDTDINFVSFEGGGAVVAALLGGHIDIMGSAVSEIAPMVADGRVKILGLGEATPKMPDVKTFAEQGVKMNFLKALRGVYVPAGLDDAVFKKLADSLKEAVNSPEFAERCATLGMTPEYLSPEECMETVENLCDFLIANKDSIVK